MTIVHSMASPKKELIKYPRENVLVSHRKSTMSLADETYEMAKGRFS